MGAGTRSAAVFLGGVALKAFVVFTCVEAALFVLDYLIVYRELVDNRDLQNLLDITHEDTIGTWVSTTQYLVLACVAWLVRLRTRDEAARSWRPTGWGLIAAFFTYMSFDDGSRFHERIGSMFGDYAPSAPSEALASAARVLLDVFPSYDWQLAFFPLFGAMAVFLLVFLWSELGDQRLYALAIGGLSCWVLAVGLDFLEGAAEGMALLQSISGASYDDIEHVIRAVEESVELFGATLILTAFLAHLTRVADGWTLRFSSSRSRAAGAAAPATAGVHALDAGGPLVADS
jgi:hypothetical protein